MISKANEKKIKRNISLAIIVIIIAIILLMRSSIFAIKDYEVIDNYNFSDAQIWDMTGFSMEDNLFFGINIKNAKNAILQSPYIRNVSIKRVLPNKIEISVTERKEFAAIKHENSYVIIDNEGFVLRSYSDSQFAFVISGMQIENFEVGKALKSNPGYLLANSLSILNKASDIGLYLEEVDCSTPLIKVYIYRDLGYLFDGTCDDILANLSKIKALVSTQYAEGIKHGKIHVGSNGYLAFEP